MPSFDDPSDGSSRKIKSVESHAVLPISATPGRETQHADAHRLSPLKEGNPMTDENAENETQTETLQPSDPYTSVQHLLVPKGEGTALPTQRVRTHIKVERPAPTSWFRVYPEWGPWDDDFRIFIYESQGDIPSQLVEPHVVAEDLGLKIKRPTLYMDRAGELRLWLIAGGSYCGATSRSAPSTWEMTAIQAAELAKTAWVRITSNKSQGIYDIHRIQEGVEVHEPDWAALGDLDPGTILSLAFPDDRRIASIDHPILRTLRGEF